VFATCRCPAAWTSGKSGSGLKPFSKNRFRFLWRSWSDTGYSPKGNRISPVKSRRTAGYPSSRLERIRLLLQDSGCWLGACAARLVLDVGGSWSCPVRQRCGVASSSGRNGHRFVMDDSDVVAADLDPGVWQVSMPRGSADLRRWQWCSSPLSLQVVHQPTR